MNSVTSDMTSDRNNFILLNLRTHLKTNQYTSNNILRRLRFLDDINGPMTYQLNCGSRSAVHGEALSIQRSVATTSPVQITAMNFVLQVKINENRKEQEGGQHSNSN